MVVLYLFGLIAIFSLAMKNYVRKKPGVFHHVLRKVPTQRQRPGATLLLLFSVPLYCLCIWVVENTVRGGSQRRWLTSTGQWFALGIRIFTLLEAFGHTGRRIWSEISGGVFTEQPDALGGQREKLTINGAEIKVHSNDHREKQELEERTHRGDNTSAKGKPLRRKTA